MALEMKTNCQICDQSLEQDSEAYICVYECTFCAPCTEERHNVCPNCGGELVRRPKRNNKSKAISLCFLLFSEFMKLYRIQLKHLQTSHKQALAQQHQIVKVLTYL